jgi:PKD repeat protein
MKSLKEYDEPIAYFTYDIDDLTVVFNASLSFDPDGTITNWAWDFGDGVEGAGIQVSHTYQTYGIYNVTLTVSDNDGKEDNIIKNIIIEKPELLKTTFIVGRLDNLSFELLFGYSFEAVKIIAISFFPFNYYFLKSGEEIKITRYYLGRLNEKYIFAICGAFIDE